jgi:hypothetical protein
MQLTTMTVLEGQASALKRSKLLTTAERDEYLRLNAQARAMLEILGVKTLEEVEDILSAARDTERMEREIAEVEAEIQATKIQQEKTSANE